MSQPKAATHATTKHSATIPGASGSKLPRSRPVLILVGVAAASTVFGGLSAMSVAGASDPSVALRQASASTAAAASASSIAAARTFAVDGSHSSVLFRVKHLNVVNFWGRFNKVSGSYTIDPANPSASSIEIDIDVDSVDSNNEGRDRHLRSPDFFNTAQFPTATFRSTSIAAEPDGTLAVEGALTIRGTTKPVTLSLTPTGEGDRGPRFGYRHGWETELLISRSEYGISYLPEGLGDEVKLVIAIQGIGQ